MAEEKKSSSAEAVADKDDKKEEAVAPAVPSSAEVAAGKDERKADDVSSDDDAPVEVPEKFKKLVEEIEKMSVLDLAELVKILEKKFGVSAAAPAMIMAGGPAGDGAGGEQAEEKTEFDVELTEFGSNKIAVIKAVRAITELGLKDAKDLVDGAPKVVKEGVKKEEAEEIKKQLEEAGGKAILK